ncbi:18S rRNA maturation protein [Podila humilis]|nr:18S rRNA maturation protein [Podila humilis]
MPPAVKKVSNPEKEMRGQKPYHRHADGTKKKAYQLKPKKLDAGEVPEGAAALKKKLRDTLRLLGKSPKMPADVRLEHERRIEALKLQIADKQVDLTEQKMQVKYRMIKFIEAKKAERKIKVFKKQHSDWENNPEEKAQLKDLELDLDYIRHFPKTMKYISLYATDIADDDVTMIARKEIREKIQTGLASGEINQFVKQVREEVKEKIVKKDPLTTKEAIKLTAEKINKSKKHTLAESDNPQLAARAKATMEREAKEVGQQESQVEEESFFETVPKVLPASKAKNAKKESQQESQKTKKPVKAEEPPTKTTKTVPATAAVVAATAATTTTTTAAAVKQETPAIVVPEAEEPKKLGKWARKALRTQLIAAAQAAASDKEGLESTAASAVESKEIQPEVKKVAAMKTPEVKTTVEKKSPEPKKAIEKKTPEPKKTVEKKTAEPKKAAEKKTPESKKVVVKAEKEAGPKITVLKVETDDNSSDSDDEKMPEAPARPVAKVDETLLKELPEVPRKRGGRNQKAYVEKPQPKSSAAVVIAETPKVVVAAAAKRVRQDSSDDEDEETKAAVPKRKPVAVDETLLKELPEIPKKRGGRNLNKYKK